MFCEEHNRPCQSNELKRSEHHELDLILERIIIRVYLKCAGKAPLQLICLQSRNYNRQYWHCWPIFGYQSEHIKVTIYSS